MHIPQVIISPRFFYFLSQHYTLHFHFRSVCACLLKWSVINEIWNLLLSFVMVGLSSSSLSVGLTYFQFWLEVWQKYVLVKLLFWTHSLQKISCLFFTWQLYGWRLSKLLCFCLEIWHNPFACLSCINVHGFVLILQDNMCAKINCKFIRSFSSMCKNIVGIWQRNLYWGKAVAR